MKTASKYKKVVGLSIILFLPATFFIVFGKLGKHNFQTLPYYGPREVVEQGSKDTLYHQLPSFHFQDQKGQVITRDSFDNQIFIAEFFEKKTNLQRVHMEFKSEPDIRFMSHSVNPEMNDSVEMTFYSGQIHVDPSNWKFVYGDEDDLEELAIEGYFKGSAPDSNIQKLIRNPVVVLVDKEHRIRGVYDASYSEEISRLMEEIRLLKKEEDLQNYRNEDV